MQTSENQVGERNIQPTNDTKQRFCCCIGHGADMVGLFAVGSTAKYLYRARTQQNKDVLWRWWIKSAGGGDRLGARPRADGFCAAFAALFCQQSGAAEPRKQPPSRRSEAAGRALPPPPKGEGDGRGRGGNDREAQPKRADAPPANSPRRRGTRRNKGRGDAAQKRPPEAALSPPPPQRGGLRRGVRPAPPQIAAGEPPRRRPQQRKGGQSPPGLTLARCGILRSGGGDAAPPRKSRSARSRPQAAEWREKGRRATALCAGGAPGENPARPKAAAVPC